MKYCLKCGQPLKKLIRTPEEGCLGYECLNCKITSSKEEIKAQEPYEVVKIRDLIAENTTLKERLLAIEEELGIKW